MFFWSWIEKTHETIARHLVDSSWLSLWEVLTPEGASALLQQEISSCRKNIGEHYFFGIVFFGISFFWNQFFFILSPPGLLSGRSLSTAHSPSWLQGNAKTSCFRRRRSPLWRRQSPLEHQGSRIWGGTWCSFSSLEPEIAGSVQNECT